LAKKVCYAKDYRALCPVDNFKGGMKETMALKIRLARGGAKKRPFYQIVVADARAPRDGRFVEKVGSYNPMLPHDNQDRIRLKEDRIKHWLSVGAQPTDRVALFLGKAKLIEMPTVRVTPLKSAPKTKAQERLKAEEEALKAKEEALKAPPPQAEPEAAPEPEAPAEVKAEEEALAAPAAEPEEAPAEVKAEEEVVAEAIVEADTETVPEVLAEEPVSQVSETQTETVPDIPGETSAEEPLPGDTETIPEEKA
jgi:small subunit ribosomal protein S16